MRRTRKSKPRIHPLTPQVAQILEAAGVPRPDIITRYLFEAGMVCGMDYAIDGHDPHLFVAHMLARAAEAAHCCWEDGHTA